MGNRLELQALLEKLLGSRNVYYQPPTNIKLQYPCIMYSRIPGDTKHANDNPYLVQYRYQIMVIDKNPDSEIAVKVEQLPTCIFDKHYASDNLNHYIYKLYYN